MNAPTDRQAIAIIGLGVRLPGADSLDAFWAHLAAGRSLISEVPARRWDKDALREVMRGSPAKGNKTSSIWGGFIEEADCFDATFFNISPREAAWMDPQQRFALELAWQAIEDAGYRASALAGSNTGVFMGVCHWDYAELLEKHLSQLDAYTPTGIAFSIIANRVSHFFDLRGPSIANDTACAASLTSVYEAVRALQSGSCDLALAGGVNLIWSPNHFIAFSRNGMLSPSGASQAFDQGADGYVRGEGGAVLLLKPLDRAVADGDPIHGVIRGVGVNHGGRTNSLTVTNPQAQAELVASVMREAGVAPASISYIEAHGTGTPLGDPIEIAGLKQAFASLYAATGEAPVPGHCGVGSVKTNIGHLEGAAGVAGIVKVLAALGHEALPANVNFRELNSLIKLDGTPFRIQSELTPWPRTSDQPRRAGVSAFGFGGSNAHVVLEEAPQPPIIAVNAAPRLIILSARDEARLLALAQGLREFLLNPEQAVSLSELAWTLQDAREAMAVKALWWVDDVTALQAALDGFIAGEVPAGSAQLADAPTSVQLLAARWLAGEAVDWRELYPDGVPRRIHAPTYRFARERHWMDAALGGKDAEPVQHPLLQRNLSQIGQQRYQSRFAGNEFFWAEHHVGSQQVLPGVVCLEMARAAWALATGQDGAAAVACRIGQMLWTRPVLAGEAPVRVGIRLSPGDAGQLAFVVECLDATGTGSSINAQGNISRALSAVPENLDLASLRAASAVLVADRLYARLAATGMHHGPSFRTVQSLHLGDGYLLASLKLPRQLRGTLDSFLLHPMLLDGAIQAWIGLEPETVGLPGAAVPFSCRQIDIMAPCSDSMWALLKPIAGREGSQEGGLRRFDISLADKTGRVCLRFHELALRVMTQGSTAVPVFSSPQWTTWPLPEAAVRERIHPRTQVLLVGFSPAVVDELRAASGLPVDVLPEIADPDLCAQSWFDALRQRYQDRRGSRDAQQWLLVLPAGYADLPGAALAALLRCVTTEQPKFFGAVLHLADELSREQQAAILLAEAGRADRYTEIRYDVQGVRHVARPQVIELAPVSPASLPDAKGVVLITGGQGGLGRHFAGWLLSRGVGHVVLAGRAPEAHGLAISGVIYRSCDVADEQQVAALVGWIEAELGPLKGIIHAAGVLRDGYLLNKQAADVDAVFAPKVTGVLNLDAATRQLPLEFFLVCSSIAATFGNPGQSDYAAANAFMDAWADARSQQVNRGERSGRTVAMAWPLWADGGMAVDGATQAALQRRFGTVPLPTAVALAALDSVLAEGAPSRITLQYGPVERISQVLARFGTDDGVGIEATQALATPAQSDDRLTLALPANALSTADLTMRTSDWLRDLLGELIQMDPVRIQAHRRLEEYGLDSIVIVEMTNRMEESLGQLSKTLFFEYVDLQGVAGYLVEEKAAALTALFSADAEKLVAPSAEITMPADATLLGETTGNQTKEATDETGKKDETEQGEHDVAIVGLSLHVAGADDQESFWRLLAQGEHGFRRYPAERWNHEALVHPERDVLGKTVVQTGAFLDGIDRFDPRYFRISQAEAELMSPEVRLFLQSCVEAFEDAGYSRETLQRKYGGDVAVIVGSMTNDYNLYGFQNMLQRGSLASGSYTGTVPNMVSYYYGFTGPSYFLDTMCSAAATCVHEAVHMLRSGRTKMALAGGISLLLHPQKLIATSQEHFTSKTAEVIRGYGLGADGTILGEGVGALVMKRLSDAERDGDHIYGVIKGSGISNAGVRNGFTVPNPRQQAAAIAKALDDSGVDPASISYIEGHGSGTALGDPIEIRALTEIYGKYMREPQCCAIGTVKSNVAHLLGAAALPGIVKVLLQMQQGKIAPSLHAETLNPNIPFADTPFRVQRQLADWPRQRDAAGGELPRRAGVTSIGAGGINVHLILEEYPAAPALPAVAAAADSLFVFSAMNVERLRALLTRFVAYLSASPAALADVAWTLQIGRNELPCRLAVVARDGAQLGQGLTHFLATGQAENGLLFTPSILDRDPRVDAAQVADALANHDLARLAAWWCDGVVIPWEQLSGASPRRRVSLPSYPFEQVRCWYQEYPDAPSVVNPLGSSLKLHPFVASNRSDRHGLRYQTPIYLNELLDYVYKVNRQPRLLPTVVVEMAAAVAHLAGFSEGLALSQLEIGYSPDWSRVSELSALVLAEGTVPLIELAVTEGGASSRPFARVRVASGTPADRPAIALDALRADSVRSLSGAALYQELAREKQSFLPYLEVVESLWQLPGDGVLLSLRQDYPMQDHFKRNVQFPAAQLGAAWQALLLLRPQFAAYGLSRVADVFLAGGVVSHLLLRPALLAGEGWDVCFLAADGSVVAGLNGLSLALPEQLAWSPRAASRAALIASAAEPSADRLTLGAPAGATTREVTPAMPPAALGAVSRPHDDLHPEAVARAAFSLGVRELVADLLKFPVAEINPRSPFHDLGFDSISLTRLANEINARYEASLTPAIFFECEHIESLAGWLAARLPAPAVVPAAVSALPATAQPVAKDATDAALLPKQAADDAVAIVGLAARLPGATDAEVFFQRLLLGDDLVGDLPLERYPAAYRSRLEAAGFPLQGGFLSDIDCFDAAFFKTSPHEASRLDPQQRLMLETAWRAVEAAGYRPDELPAATGVFVGVSGRDYASLLQDAGVDSDAYVATGNSLAMVANRLSWQFNLHGPSEAVDTACSSSLVALLRAVEAIRSGRCAMALAGGVNLALSIEGFAGPWQAGMLSPSGRCRTFSSAADGYVRGEGAVVLVLKGRAAAERDGDRILGLIAGGAVNHGGHAGSLTAPSAKAQAELVQQAMLGIEPASIGYIETHGTGTSLGDPVEINGLRLAYAGLDARLPRDSIGLGSVKSNIGHLEAAAGLAGVLKVILAMAARTLPPTLHCASVNPYIELQDSPFYLVRSRQTWSQPVDADGRLLPRRAGVSSFGFGGSNAHVVLEEYPGSGQAPRREALPPKVFASTRYWLPVAGEASEADRVSAGSAPAASPALMLVPHWQALPLPSPAQSSASSGALTRRRLILPCEFPLVAGAGSATALIAVPPLLGTPAARYQTLAGILLQALQQAVTTGIAGELLIQLLVPRDGVRSVHAGLAALLDSVTAEMPRVRGQVVEVPATWSAAEALACLDREAGAGQHRRVRYQEGERFVRLWRDLPPVLPPISLATDWRPGGIYLISGGLGALGRLVAADIARRAPGASLVLAGASPLDPARQAALEDLRRLGAKVHYRQLDICDAAAVSALVEDCQAQYGGLHGVIHCAGIHRDSAFIRKTPAQLQAVLAPKVLGAWALHEACRGLALDCFVHFSSLAGAVGNAGQADYAAANGFLDALAESQGAPMLAIDWPLWRDGGMQVDAAGEQAFFAQMGQRPLASAAGLTALRSAISSGHRQLAVVAGEADRIRAFFRQAAMLPGLALGGEAGRTIGGVAAGIDTVLRRAVGQHLGELLGRIAGLSATQIELDQPLENYGIDSLMINRLNQALGERFGRLSKTLFFEHRTLGQVAAYLLNQHAAACRDWVGQEVLGAPGFHENIAVDRNIGAISSQLDGRTFATGATGEVMTLAASPSDALSHSNTHADAPEPIAIIGLSGRYPGAADVHQFWANLLAGRESIVEIPAERWSLDGFYEADPEQAVAQGLSYSRWGGFLDGFADFDPLFFRISPREALAMDPQERLFLMEAWAACEDAGYTRTRLAEQMGGRVGVFVGVTKTGYALHGLQTGSSGSRVRPSTSFASVANRVSFCLGLQGPSMPIDTMCSSSLTAIHEACAHLHRGECDMALAGGVNLYLHPDNYIELCAARMLSPDGHCRSFGAGGNGFVPGEGVGCVVLKPLSRALADGDQIHGLIRGSAINHGGTTSGYTVPNPLAQGEVVKAALARAGIDPASIGYIEAHGTGTELGDPIEFSGLCQAFAEREGAAASATCALGSVKSAIGHLEAAAGIAGLTKVLLQLRHQQLVPTLHADTLNPNLELAGTPFHLQRQLAAWPAPSGVAQAPRRAGVSSFGAGGANAHLVLEEWPRAASVRAESVHINSASRQAILLSARHAAGLRAVAERLLAFIEQPAVGAETVRHPALIPVIGELLAGLLSVDAADFDPHEPLDSYGLEPVHRHALRHALEQRFEISLSVAAVADWDCIATIAAALTEVLPAAIQAVSDSALPPLADLAWTLQTGREAMEYRLAIQTTTYEELAHALRAWLQAVPGQNPDGTLSGNTSGRRSALGLLADEPDVQSIIGRWLAAGAVSDNLARVLGLWVHGVDVDWRLLPRQNTPSVVSAPTYPFARERYWPLASAAASSLPTRQSERLTAVLEKVLHTPQPGRVALQDVHDELESQLAKLVRAVLPDLSTQPLGPAWEPWRTALLDLLAAYPGSAGEDLTSAWAAWTTYRQRAAIADGPTAQIRLVETVLHALPEILDERLAATAVMFPDGRMDLVEAVYKQNAVAGRFNACLAQAAAAVLAERRALNPACRLRILEIGAGTGGTTEPVLAALSVRSTQRPTPLTESIAEYCYTDVSRAFLIHGERHFRARAPWLRPTLFDVEQPLAGQDVVPGGYDLVIAANVLHATRYIDRTLANVRDLLAPGGILLVNETSCATLFTHLTFGLLEGWWRFADASRRIPGSPALTPNSWQALVGELGLVWLGGTPDEEHALGQQVWAAQRKGDHGSARDAYPGDNPDSSTANPGAAATLVVPSTGTITAAGTAKDLAGLIVAALATTLNLAPTQIDAGLSFADYGLDSILGAELVHRLRQQLDVKLVQTDLFDYPSVSQLAVHLQALGASIAKVNLPPVAAESVSDISASKAALMHGADRLELTLPQAPPARSAPPELGEPIAIVGYSGRFAGSAGPEALWQHLMAGDDLVQPVSRFDLAPFYRDAEPGSWCQHGSFISDIDRFDARFFNISGLEATYMDPQQRLFLEEAWRTLEHAGHAGADIEGRRCGVFVGCAHGDYQELFRSQPPGQAFWGNTCSLIPARIAYHLNLKGPAVAVDTACSSSLVAVHLACQSLWQGDADLALAGGVFIQSSPRFYRYANQAGMLSPSGRCAAFGAGADGIVPGEAVAAVLLRPLSQALADGDTIHGVIVASGINQDGSTNGITAPSALSQEQLIREVYQRYGIDPARIGLVEAHGTGTPLGDPIEHAALSRAYRGWTAARGYCALGSIKSNLGHATTAAGITGLLKVLLALEHEQIPPTLHAGEPNPALSMADSPFFLNDRPLPWPTQPEQPRQAAISSFGFGGTNAHLVIEENIAVNAAKTPEMPACLCVLSARSAEQLRAQAAALLAHLPARPEQRLSDVAYTLAVGRRHFVHRLAVLAEDRAALGTRLAAWLAGEGDADTVSAVVSAQCEDGATQPDLPGRAFAGDALGYCTLLRQLAQAFLAGDDAAPSRQFAAGSGQRIPLPTYVFAGKSYWVDAAPGSVELAVSAGESLTQPLVPPAQAARLVTGTARRVVHRLLPPAECFRAEAEAKRKPRHLRPVQLAPLTERLSGVARLQRLPDVDGLRTLQIVGPWDVSLLAELAGELSVAAADLQVTALLLTGDWWAPLDFNAAPAALAVPLLCPLPIIAAVPAARGAGLALAAHCDFLILAENGLYHGQPGFAADFASDLAGGPAALLRRRFGLAAVRRLRGEVAGRELASGLAVVAPEVLAEQAMALARQIVAAPRLALVELKAHMRRGPQAPQDLPPPPLGSRELAEGLPTADEQALRGAPQRLALASPVIALELFDDGVAVLHMLERQHKNTFTPAFMEGITEAFARLAEMPACKVLVLTGHDAYFACGGTREGLESLQRGDTRFTDQRIYSLPLDFPLPVIAAMQGHAIGAGWSLGMFCDLALFAADSVYHSNYLRFGFTPGAGATLVFPHRLGDDLGREVLFSAREFKGRELARRGMPLPVFPAGEVLPRALAVAHRLASQTPQQLQAAKAAASAVLHGEIEAVLVKEVAMHEKTFIGNPLVMERIASSFAATQPASGKLPDLSGGQQAGQRAALRQQLVETLAEELLLAPTEIADSDGFLALGLDSILAVTWVRKLNARLGIALPATCVYAQPTVGALLGEVARLLGSAHPVVSVEAAAPVFIANPPATSNGPDRQALRRAVVDTLAEELLMAAEDIDDSAGFLELGLDSILAVTWIRKLNARLDITLPATCVYAQPTVGALLQEVLRLLPTASAALTGPTAAPEVRPPVTHEPVLPILPRSSPPSLCAVRSMAESRGESGAEFSTKSGTRSAAIEPIAIIGAAGRFPKAADLAAFWSNIRDGRDCIDEVPLSRWDVAAYYDPDPQVPGKSYSKWMGVIDDIDLFDAPFFNITAREAELMDPQQRLFLQHAWQAIEDAAIDPADLAGSRCGVFVGSGNSGYGELIHETNAYSLIGSAGSILAARIAYLLDLRGPSVALDTACSTSLVAIAQACDSLLLGNTDLALAGGACVLLGPRMHIDTSKVGMLSPDGRCYSFDQRANGFVPGEGVGVVLLKRLADAERDGDPIRAVIRGWGSNQDGHTNGITAPNPLAQGALLSQVYRRFAIAPASIGLIETHGTGTPLGDPIEIEGLRAGFGPVDAGTSVAIGSVKSNVGHLLAAAGVAGAIKAMLALEHGELPPSIHFERQNEHLALAGSPFHVQTVRAPWPVPAGVPRRAAVSAFGFSGTNAHLVLEEYRPVAPATSGAASSGPLLCLLSARSRAQLAALAAGLLGALEAQPELNLADLCWTLQRGRRAFECRAASLFSSRAELLGQLRALAAGQSVAGLLTSGNSQGARLLFDDDGDVQALLGKWLAAGRLERLAEVWLQGAVIDWRQLAGTVGRRRLRLPGYPFAAERHWLKPLDAAPDSSRTTKPSLVVRGAAGDAYFRCTLRGDEACLSLQRVGGDKLLSGLFYPELARAAGELADKRTVRGLRHLVWGRPLSIAARPYELALTVQLTEAVANYRIAVEGDENLACQVGELLWADEMADAWPTLPADAPLLDVLADFCQARPAARGILAVARSGEGLQAEWSRPPGDATMAFDPLALDAVWQLVAFFEQQAGLPGPRFPLAVASLRFDGCVPDEGTIRVWQPVAHSQALTVLLIDQAGKPCLCLEGVVSEQLDALAELHFEGEAG